MEARCPRGPGAATTATPQGARTPNWPTQCYHCMEGWEGLLETSKPSKNHPQPQNCNNKYSTRTETACKTVKTDKCSHSSSQNPNRSDTVSTSGAYRGFVAIPDQWRHIMAAWIKEKPESRCRKIRKPHWKPNPKTIRQLFMTKTENHMLKNGKSAIRNEHPIRKTKILWHKNRS